MRDIVDVLSAETSIGWALRLPLRLLPKGRTVPILTTAARGKRWILGSGPHSCWLGINERRKRSVFSKAVNAGDVVFDVGANVGSYTILASVLVGPRGRVIAFEPAPQNVAFLRQHVRINGLDNVEVVEAAVTEQSGSVRFHLDTDRVRGRVTSDGEYLARATSLDDVASECNAWPACIKIDVEGGEAAVLAGAARVLEEGRPIVFLATHGPDTHQQCCEILKGAHYSVGYVGPNDDEIVAFPRPAPRTEAPVHQNRNTPELHRLSEVKWDR
jgi:FkbM family methyltransferase